MEYRKLGRTGIDVSALIFGCGNVGGLLIRGSPDDMRHAVTRAVAAGINWFDTAEAYGDGKSEESLGQMLSELGTTPHVSTKIRLDTADLSDMPGEIEHHLEASLKRLRRDRVDVVQFHNFIGVETGGRAISIRDVLRPGGVADGLDRVRDKGLADFIGLTALGDAAACRQAIGSGRFDTAQVYYNLLNPSAGRRMPTTWTGQDFAGVIDACRAHDTGVIAIRVFAAGVLASDVRHGREAILTQDTHLVEEERKARAVAESLGTGYGTRAQTAIRFVLANRAIDAINIGLAEPAQLDEALPAVVRGALPDDALAKLARLYETDFAAA